MNATRPHSEGAHAEVARAAAARVFTGAGWLEGTFHLGKLDSFAEYLAHHTWYPMTEVAMTKVGMMPFFALAREATVLVAPRHDVPQLVGGPRQPLKATLIFQGGSIDATVELPANLRLSDFVGRAVGFLPVRNATVRVWADHGAQSYERLFVNPARLVGVTEQGLP